MDRAIARGDIGLRHMCLIGHYAAVDSPDSVGANTVHGPGPFNLSTRPAAFTAATRVWNCPAAAAVGARRTTALVVALGPRE